MKHKHIAIVHLSNWQGLYVDGKLKAEGYEIDVQDLNHALKLNIHNHYPDDLPLSKSHMYYKDKRHMPKKLTSTFEGLV